MTRKDIEEIADIRKEIQMLNDEIESLRQQSLTLGGASDGMPHSTNVGSPVEQIAIKILDLTRDLERRKIMLMEKLNRALIFIYTIDDSLTRMIVKYKCIDGLNYSEISAILGYDRSVIGKKYNAFFNELGA